MTIEPAGGTEAAGPATAAVRRAETVILSAFGSFGLTWGMYAAAIPAIRAATAVSDGFLGLALSAGGLAALPTMLLAGRLLDRFGRRAFVTVLALFAIAAPIPAFVTSGPALVVALLALGGCSGALDVAINHAAVEAEATTARRLLNRAHATFSLGLLAGSLILGAARVAGSPPGLPLLVLGFLLLAGAIPAWLGLGARETVPDPPGRSARQAWCRPLVWVAGTLGVFALLVESGLQQWSAVFLEDVLRATPGISSLGPAAFAGAAAAGRLAGHVLGRVLTDVPILLCAGLVAAPGTLLVAMAGRPAMALAGLVLAGMGISVAAPTLYGFAGRRVPASARGSTIAGVAGIAYLGLLSGPGAVGMVADLLSLRWAFGLLAGIALAMGFGALALRPWVLGDR